MSRINNFDTIRLLAALQVLIWHAASQLNFFDPIYGFLRVLFHFPGVPIFFALSGFLLSYSVHGKPFDWKRYAKNRLLRIYPALWICTLLTAISILWVGPSVPLRDWGVWLISQLTFFQPYVPQTMKSWGVGHPNGSLWSIAVELQYYVVLPLIWMRIKSFSRQMQSIFLVVIALFSLLFHASVDHFFASDSLVAKLATVSLPYHLYFFVYGMLVYLHWDRIRTWLENKVVYWFLAYFFVVIVGAEWLGWYQNPYDYRPLGLLANGLLVGLVFSFAFSFLSFSERILKGYDISYGLYIYHMPIVNVLVTFHATHSGVWVVVVLVVSILFAWSSWKWIEKPMLRLK